MRLSSESEIVVDLVRAIDDLSHPLPQKRDEAENLILAHPEESISLLLKRLQDRTPVMGKVALILG